MSSVVVPSYSDILAWMKRKRRTILLTAAAVGAGVGTYYLVKQYYDSLEEERQRLEIVDQQHQEAEERAEAQLQSHFESVQKISDSTTLPSVLPHLKGRLFEAVDLSGLTERLMAGKQGQNLLSSGEKMQIWQDLKVLSFTRTFCAIWSVTLLDLFVRTQLNILGRHVYIDTAQSTGAMNSSQDDHKPLTLRTQHRFIAFADYLPHKGLDMLISDCHSVVQPVVQRMQLKDLHTLEQVREIFTKIQENFMEEQFDWVRYVLPDDNSLPEDLAAASSAADAVRSDADIANDLDEDAMLDQLIEETRSALNSTGFQQVLSRSLEVVLDGIIDELQRVYGNDPLVGVHLAKLLPPIASVGSSLLDQPQDNLYIQKLANLQEVKSFCALVYANNIEYGGAMPRSLDSR